MTLLLVLMAAGYQYFQEHKQGSIGQSKSDTAVSQAKKADKGNVEHSNTELQRAFQQRKSDYQIQGKGTVVHILPDDNEGSRHQRFILKTALGQSVLVAHNIDLAPKIDQLSKGDSIEFFGEYEWNPKGGVVHWTHHDPKGYHVGGWLKHQGKVYQ